MLVSLRSPSTAFVHFRNQRSMATTWRTTGEPSIASEASKRRENRQCRTGHRHWTIAVRCTHSMEGNSFTQLVLRLLHSNAFINPRRACPARVTVFGLCVCVCVCFCYHVFYHCEQQGGQEVIPTGSALSLLRSTKHGNYLMDNWWTERCLRSRLQRQTASNKQKSNFKKIDRRSTISRVHAQRISLYYKTMNVLETYSEDCM